MSLGQRHGWILLFSYLFVAGSEDPTPIPGWNIRSVVANLSALKTVTLIPRILFQALTASVEQRRSEKKEICQEQSGSTCDRSDTIENLKKEVAEVKYFMREANRSVGNCSSEDKNDSDASEEGISGFTKTEVVKSLRSKEESLEEQRERAISLQNTVMEKNVELRSLQQQREQADADRKKLTQGKLEVEFVSSKTVTDNEHQQTEVQELRRENVILKKKVLRYETKELKDLEKALGKLRVSEYGYRLIVCLSLDRGWLHSDLESWSLVPKDIQSSLKPLPFYYLEFFSKGQRRPLPMGDGWAALLIRKAAHALRTDGSTWVDIPTDGSFIPSKFISQVRMK